ncbi:MAG: sulfite exporter TauE/SafE family protein [Nitratireductor sp.]
MINQILEFSANTPWFYAVAIPAILMLGLAKGGFGGGMAGIVTPMVALVIAPVTAAAIILPILLVGDAIGVYNYRQSVKWSVFWTIVPATIIGITIGALTASYLSDDFFRLALGTISIFFASLQFTKDMLKHKPKSENKKLGYFWGSLAGLTSFISHSGAPPYQAYVLPLKLDKVIYAGTTAVTFACINSIKVVPYFALGQFNSQNLWISVSLIPFAVIGAFIGIWAVKRASQGLFYNITYAAMIIIGIKLIWDGRGAILSLF